ncbi:hypothetical protein ABL166_000824 [Shigella flexneri]|nr:hypothetical protein [Shigella flexneri]
MIIKTLKMSERK